MTDKTTLERIANLEKTIWKDIVDFGLFDKEVLNMLDRVKNNAIITMIEAAADY